MTGSVRKIRLESINQVISLLIAFVGTGLEKLLINLMKYSFQQFLSVEVQMSNFISTLPEEPTNLLAQCMPMENILSMLPLMNLLIFWLCQMALPTVV